MFMAERQGFEPWNTREDVTGIPVQRLRPLGHLSVIAMFVYRATAGRRYGLELSIPLQRVTPHIHVLRPGGADCRARLANRSSSLQRT